MFEGTLEDGELLPTLRWIAALRQGGLLSVQGEPDLVSVTFEAGAIVAADAMNRPAEEMLGEVLARRGLLDPADFAAAVEPFMGTGRLASEVLAERGLVSRDDLLEAVREQTYSQVVRLLRWDSGNFNWTPKVESPFEVGMRPISVAELLLRSSEDLGVEGPLRGRPPGLDEVFQGGGEAKSPLRVIGRDDDWEPGSTDTNWLTPAEDRLLAVLLEHPATGTRLASETGLDPLEVCYALHELRRAGLVRSMETVSGPAIEGDILEAPGLPALGSSVEEAAEDWSAATLLDPQRSDIEVLPPMAGELRFDEGLDVPAPIARGGELADVWIPPGEPAIVEPSSGPFGTGTGTGTGGSGTGTGTGTGTGRRPRRGVSMQRTATWLARGLGVALALVIVSLLARHGQRGTLLLPFPWQRDARLAFEDRQVTALYDKIDRAVRTYYLLYGRYPEELGILVDLELLRARELFDPRGRWLQYAVAEGGYTLRPVASGASGVSPGIRAELSSDFFLDPKFVELPSPRPNPVVLLQ